MVYATLLNGEAAAFQSLKMLKKICGENAAYAEVPEKDYFLAGKKLYAHNGVILAGKTGEEKALIGLYKQAEAAKSRLAAVDREAGAGRAVRGLALAAAAGQGIESADCARLRELEARAETLRAELAGLLAEAGGINAGET